LTRLDGQIRIQIRIRIQTPLLISRHARREGNQFLEYD